MTRDQLVRLLLRLGIAFVALQIAGFVIVLALFAYVWFGGEPPMFHDALADMEIAR